MFQKQKKRAIISYPKTAIRGPPPRGMEMVDITLLPIDQHLAVREGPYFSTIHPPTQLSAKRQVTKRTEKICVIRHVVT